MNIELSPLFFGPIIYPVASSKFKTQVADPFIPILFSIDPVEIPFFGPTDPFSLTIYFGTRNKLMPLVPEGESEALARTRCMIFSVKS